MRRVSADLYGRLLLAQLQRGRVPGAAGDAAPAETGATALTSGTWSTRWLHATDAAGANEAPSLGGMPASNLRKTGTNGPHAPSNSELHQPATTFRQAVVEAVHAQEVETPEDTPEADHPAYKYQEAHVEGRAPRADDTGIAGMPEGHDVATPAEGLGHESGVGRPEPAGGRQAGLDSVPNELGASPQPHNEDTTRMRWGPEEDEPLIRHTGAPEVDATMEPGTIPSKDRRGSTELMEDPEAAERLERKTAPLRTPDDRES